MTLSEADMQVLRRAVDRADSKGEPAMAVRTAAVVDLGGVEILPKSDQERFNKTPDAGRSVLTSQVTVNGMKKLLSTSAPVADDTE